MNPVPHTASAPDLVEVVAGLMYNAARRRYLLVQRHPSPKVPEWSEKWSFPGGKVEMGETPEEALVREMQEEVLVPATVGPLLHAAIYRAVGYPPPYSVRTYEVWTEEEPMLSKAGGQYIQWCTLAWCAQGAGEGHLLPGTWEAIQSHRTLYTAAALRAWRLP